MFHSTVTTKSITIRIIMNALITAALVLVFLPPTYQRCHDEQYAQENCQNRYNSRYGRYERICTNYYEMHCYEVKNELESAHMDSVHKIIVRSGDMKSINSALFKGFNNVRSVTITESDIETIQPNSFTNLPYLESVNLTGNALEVLSQASFDSRSLKTLDLSNNNISTIEYNPFTSVSKLILHHNQITNISYLVAVCTSLEALDLSYNNINVIELPENCQNLLSLNATHTELSKFTVTSNKSLVLNSLDLSYNSLNDISSTNLYNLATLSSLNLNNNPLFYAENPSVDLFQNTLRLEVLNLSATGIQEIYVGTFSKLSSLKLLDLSQNNLTTLPKGIFHDLKSLEQLHLNDNRLTYFYYEGLTKLAKINLNANLFTCNALVDIANTLTQKNVDIVSGNTRDAKNIFGINCLDTAEDSKAIANQFDPSADHQSNEFYKFFSKIEQIMQQSLVVQENRSLVLADQQTKSDVSWRNFTQEYKGLLQTLQQSISDTVHKITEVHTTPNSTNAVKINELELGKYSLEQWKLLQRNFTETLKSDRNDFLGAMRSSFNMLISKLSDITQDIKGANTVRNVSYGTDASFAMTSSFTNSNEKIAAANGSNKALIVGTYGIFLVLLIGLVLSLLSIFKSCRNTKVNHEECNPLSGMPV
ncbi:hypothetical protein AMK59_1809 [Oryctes borbonicus]|uniref:Uncharacterized protein n=1 Tax=Oryctes borbonicus TaxID=1629725 RepID=A0A0T6BGK3_9SCAR|nr:hypothetical protein AMK59_1809 [Oryctes borbonicus]